MALYPDTSCFYRAEVIASRAIDRVSLLSFRVSSFHPSMIIVVPVDENSYV